MSNCRVTSLLEFFTGKIHRIGPREVGKGVWGSTKSGDFLLARGRDTKNMTRGKYMNRIC